jgi:GNAT superfamily N-acetyltransferase
MIWTNKEFELDTDPARLDMNRLVEGLQTTYWAKDRTHEIIVRAWKNSAVVFGMYDRASGKLIGFARVVTDSTIVAYLADVFLFPEYRGRGLGKWLMQCMLDQPDLATVRWLLNTRDMHKLYAQFDFRPADDTVMARDRPPSRTTPQ